MKKKPSEKTYFFRPPRPILDMKMFEAYLHGVSNMPWNTKKNIADNKRALTESHIAALDLIRKLQSMCKTSTSALFDESGSLIIE